MKYLLLHFKSLAGVRVISLNKLTKKCKYRRNQTNFLSAFVSNCKILDHTLLNGIQMLSSRNQLIIRSTHTIDTVNNTALEEMKISSTKVLYILVRTTF